MGRWKREGEKERKKNIRSVMSLARGIFLIFRVALFYLLFILGREAGTETRRWERGRRAGGSGGTKRPGPLPPHPELRAAGPGGGCPVPGAARPCLPHPARPRAQLRGSCSPSPRLPSPLPLSRHTRAVIRQQMNALSRQGPPADSRPVGGGRDRGAEPRTAPRPRRRTGAGESLSTFISSSAAFALIVIYFPLLLACPGSVERRFFLCGWLFFFFFFFFFVVVVLWCVCVCVVI